MKKKLFEFTPAMFFSLWWGINLVVLIATGWLPEQHQDLGFNAAMIFIVVWTIFVWFWNYYAPWYNRRHA